MPPSPHKPRTIHHDSQPLPKGRVVTLGASARKRERFLFTSLLTVSLSLIALVGTEVWMFQKGILVFQKSSDPIVISASSASLPSPVLAKTPVTPSNPTPQSKAGSQKQHTQTVAATMAPTPASGKFEDIVLPADKPTGVDQNIKVEAPKPTKSLNTEKSSPISPASAPQTQKAAPSVTQPVSTPLVPAKGKLHDSLVTTTPSKIIAPPPQKILAPAPSPVMAPAPSPSPSPVMEQKLSPAMEEARLDVEKSDFASALVLYDRVLDRDAKNVVALTGKADALLRTGQYESAIDLDHQLLKLHPDNKAGRDNLIEALGQSSTLSSQHELQKIIIAEPHNEAAQAALARALAHQHP